MKAGALYKNAHASQSSRLLLFPLLSLPHENGSGFFLHYHLFVSSLV